MKPRSSYDVNAVWPADRVRSVDQCLRSLLRLQEANATFHGAHEPWEQMLSTLDVSLAGARRISRAAAVEIETELLVQFARQGTRHLAPQARNHIERDRLIFRSYRTTGTMFVGRHFGLPTRCVDWTTNSLAGLFFACRRCPDKDGVVWWVSQLQLESQMKAQWSRDYAKHDNVELEFERRFSRAQEHDVIVRLNFPPWMPRTFAQSSSVTVAGSLGIDHAKAISLLKVKDCARLLIPARLKSRLLDKLDAMGVNGHALQMGDSTVETIAGDVASAALRDR